MEHNEEDNHNGIIKIKQNGVEYTVWTHVAVVRKYVREDLKKRFPDKLIAREINSVDYSVPELDLPVEIQSTIVSDSYIKYSAWEDCIRRQIEQNIVGSGRCLFYFDSELLSAMSNASRTISVNMDWFRKYMKEEKLKVFIVRYDGIIEEKEYKDFDFLSNVSQTCSMAAEKDDMTLSRNKMKIYTNVIKGYSFTLDEIEKIEDDYEKHCEINETDDIDNNRQFRKFLVKSNNERSKLYGHILQATNDLPKINDILRRKIDKDKYVSDFRKYTAKILGIFDTVGHGSGTVARFVDKFDICKYFPGYLRSKDTWNKLRGLNITARQYQNIVTGKTDAINGLDYYMKKYDCIDNNIEGNIDRDTTQSQTYNDKWTNIKMNSKNINTKQVMIEDAWN